MIKFLFFAQLADHAEQDSVELEFSNGVTTRDAVDLLEPKLPKKLIDALRFDAAMLSVNQAIAGWDDPLKDGDEVAFLPPFSGG